MNKGKKIFLIMLVTTLLLSSFTQVDAAKDEKIDFKIEPIKLWTLKQILLLQGILVI